MAQRVLTRPFEQRVVGSKPDSAIQYFLWLKQVFVTNTNRRPSVDLKLNQARIPPTILSDVLDLKSYVMFGTHSNIHVLQLKSSQHNFTQQM